MAAKVSYASILHAIGQVLDQMAVKSFALREEENGLVVEGFNADGQLQVQMRYDVAGLDALMSQVENTPSSAHSSTDAQLLQRFLADHKRELVGTTS
jgi:hypothetical protein